MNIRRRTAADLDSCEALASVVRTVDGDPPHLRQELRDFVACPDALDRWVAQDASRLVGHVALNTTTSDEVMALASDALDKPPESLGVVGGTRCGDAAWRRWL